MTPIRVVIIDDHRLVAASLTTWLESFPDIVVVGVTTSGEAAFERLVAWAPDVILQDLLLPGRMDGIEVIRRLREIAPAAKVVALTASVDEPRMMGALRVGAAGYVRKSAEPETLLAAVRAVHAGHTFIDPSVTYESLAASENREALTAREIDVLRLLALGRSNRDIASALGIGDETVKTHVGRVLAKLGVENRAQAIVEALRRRLVSPEDLDGADMGSP